VSSFSGQGKGGENYDATEESFEHKFVADQPSERERHKWRVPRNYLSGLHPQWQERKIRKSDAVMRGGWGKTG